MKTTVNPDHVAKQRKKKSLKDGVVYSSLGGVVEMHKLGKLPLSEFDDKTINKIFSELIQENNNLNKRVDKTKDALIKITSRLKALERKMSDYGF